MVRPVAIGSSLPEDDRSTTGHGSRPSGVRVLARVVSLKQQLKKGEELRVCQLDAEVAKWFDAACGAYGKADALAEELGVDKSHLSRMRTGEKPVPLRALIPFLDSVPAIEAFLSAIASEVDGIEVRRSARITKEELCVELVRFMLESGPLMKLFAAEVARRRGIDSDDVMRALEE